jgi:hypothetical protein
MTNSVKKFTVGFSVAALVAAFLNLLPYLRTRGAYHGDGFEVVGFPFVFRSEGGFAWTYEFSYLALIADLGLALVVALGVGYACSRISMTMTWPIHAAPVKPMRAPRLHSVPAVGGLIEPRRSPSQTVQESRPMKATGYGHSSGEVQSVGFRRQPDKSDHRCSTTSGLASPATFAARFHSLRSDPVGPANGRQPARRVAMRTPPVAGSCR